MMRLLLAFLLLGSAAFSQRTIQIIDVTTEEAVPFARVDHFPGTPVLTDIDGYFTLQEEADSVKISAAGFVDTVFAVSTVGAKIAMEPLADVLEEFVVLPGINPAIRIMEAAIANRKKNHPMGDKSFVYDSYSKFVFTMDQDALASIADTVTDSSLIAIKKLFGMQHLFLMESTSKKYFDPPYKEKEVITAYKVSGFTDPAFSTFASEMQSFNFYDNQFDLLGKTYINPLAFGSIRRYWFVLEDSVVTGSDTTYTIRFQPQKGKNFDGMKGYLYINTNGYALEKVIAEPAEPSVMIQPKIIQEYRIIDGKWFPVKLSTEAVFPAVRLSSNLENGFLVGKGSTYIENVQIGADVSKQRFNAIAVQTSDDAGDKDTSHWIGTRKYQLTDKEKNTYVVIDSISRAEKFDQKLTLFRALGEGKIPLGYFQADIKRLIDYRDYEGYRFGLGLETSKKLWKRGTVGGYFGYGTRDKMWKYGGYGEVMLVPDYLFKLNISYQRDLVSRSGADFLTSDQTFSFDELYQHLYVRNMENQEKAELALSGYVRPNIRLLGFVNRQSIVMTQGYAYTTRDSNVIGPGLGFYTGEYGGELVWTFREKWMMLGNMRVKQTNRWPQLTFRYAASIPGLSPSFVDYVRLNAELKHTIGIRAVGNFSYKISAGKTFGEAPLYLQHVAVGTGGDWNVSVPNTFETMTASTFFNNEQVALFTRFAFKKWKTNKAWTSPQLVLHHAVGFGKFKEADRHYMPDQPFRSMEKGYYEAGVLVNNLVNSGFVGIGIGAFYNYGPYSVPRVEDNITIKLGVTFDLFK
jgi:hypothetical protein